MLATSVGCGSSLVPLTQELRQEHQLSDDELANLQFYLSDTVTLRRELESGGRQVTGSHTLLLTSGKTIEEVVVEGETPGVAVEVGPDSLAISFEEGTFLLFGTRSLGDEPSGREPQFAEAPDPFPGNDPDHVEEVVPARPVTVGTGRYFLLVDERGQVKFQGRVFEAVEETFRAHLLIDAESLEDVVESRTVLKGRRLDD